MNYINMYKGFLIKQIQSQSKEDIKSIIEEVEKFIKSPSGIDGLNKFTDKQLRLKVSKSTATKNITAILYRLESALDPMFKQTDF